MVKAAMLLLAASVATSDAGECYCSCCNWCHMTECYDGHSCCDDPTCSGCDDMPDPDAPRDVEISYRPKGLAAAQQDGGCTIDHYLLLFKPPQLALVGVNDKRHPCDDGWTVADVHGWRFSAEGLFSAPSDKESKKIFKDDSADTKSCLMLDGLVIPWSLTVTNFGSAPCTSKNDVKDGGWIFNQEGVFDGVCMEDIPAADLHTTVVDSSTGFHAQKPPGDCSTSWKMDTFEEPTKGLQSKLPQHTAFRNATTLRSGETCPQCLESLGNFACAHPGKNDCMLAPTQKVCEDLGGEWCGPVGWKEHGTCGPQCAGAVDPLQQPDQAGCTQLGGVFKTSASDCARFADGLFDKSDCRASLMTQNNYDEQDALDCEALIEASKKTPANVFDHRHGYAPDAPPRPVHCRLWQCTKFTSETSDPPAQDGNQAWLMYTKVKPLTLSMAV